MKIIYKLIIPILILSAMTLFFSCGHSHAEDDGHNHGSEKEQHSEDDGERNTKKEKFT